MNMTNLRHTGQKNITQKILALILAAALISFFAPAAAAGEAREDLLVLGDSIAAGYGLADPDTETYGAKLAEAMGLSGQDYQNLAQNGATSGSLLELLKTPEMAAALSAHTTIVVSIGGNDILAPVFAMAKQALGLAADTANEELQAALAENPSALGAVGAALVANQAQFVAIIGDFAENLAEIAELIQTASPEARVYIQTIYDPFGGAPGFETLSFAASIVLGQMNEAIAGGAADFGYSVVDIASAFAGAALMYTNIAVFDIHPNAAGHAVIFDELYAAICEIPEKPDETAVFENPFADVGEDAWYYEGVAAVYTAGLMRGVSLDPCLFAPDAGLTRAMAATIFYRLKDSSDVTIGLQFNDDEDLFDDVPEGAWYYDAVKWAVQTGLLSVSDGIADPGGAVGLEKFAFMIGFYAALVGADLDAGDIIAQIPALPDLSAAANRAQAAAMLAYALPAL